MILRLNKLNIHLHQPGIYILITMGAMLKYYVDSYSMDIGYIMLPIKAQNNLPQANPPCSYSTRLKILISSFYLNIEGSTLMPIFLFSGTLTSVDTYLIIFACLLIHKMKMSLLVGFSFSHADRNQLNNYLFSYTYVVELFAHILYQVRLGSRFSSQNT